MADDGSAQKALKERPLVPVKEEKPRIVFADGKLVEKQDKSKK